ncbi:MAG: hypothetical protein KC621_08045, partial [Myxococcales bacterium]|nr:hypothetical protein [Myxococcales bacterium]
LSPSGGEGRGEGAADGTPSPATSEPEVQRSDNDTLPGPAAALPRTSLRAGGEAAVPSPLLETPLDTHAPPATLRGFARLLPSEPAPWAPLFDAPTDRERPIRVALDGLEVEIHTHHRELHVTVHGPTDQLRSLQDLAPELRTELAADGVALGTYTTRDDGSDRDPHDHRPPQEAPEGGRKQPSTRASAWRSGRRKGRYA